jgi:hypothetical protein
MHERLSIPFRLAAGAAALAFCASAGAVQRNVLVSIENLAPTNSNSISFAPLHVAFNSGSFDAFNEGVAAGPEIISVAELGAGSEWQSAFAMADPTAVRGAIDMPFPLLPGASGSKLFSLIDTTLNPFFTFAAMLLPSNDHFIGNDSPTQYRLFDAAGNLAITSITLMASDIWDAGSEAFDAGKAAFVAGSDASLRNCCWSKTTTPSPTRLAPAPGEGGLPPAPRGRWPAGDGRHRPPALGPGAAGPDAARRRRLGRVPPPARAPCRRAGDHAQRTQSPRRTACWAWNWAPTTTWPSRFRCSNWWRACARCCAASNSCARRPAPAWNCASAPSAGHRAPRAARRATPRCR